ncbi:hypothetical protein FQN51_003655 [Onygenales sp. PD_10]|nr:hypothetical protein FQN51_003655 [Onygenales sp. PD_10]
MAFHKPMTFSGASESLEISSARLEIEYEKALFQTQLVIGDERDRILRVHTMLSDYDKYDLLSQLEETKRHLERADRISAEAREQLNQAQSDLASTRNSLRANLAVLHATAADSSKILAEKLSMTREIANLKTEIEHLRTQSLSHQSSVAEKLSLERQLNSLEVELETERRALEKARLRGTEQSDEDGRLGLQVEELNRELSKERREREKLEKDTKAEATEWARHRSVLESKLTALRNKLRVSKDNPRESKERNTSHRPESLGDPDSVHPEETASQKRSLSSRFESDITIATPGAVAAPRRVNKVPTLPGDKSTFSMTPFLNRTSTDAQSSDMSESDTDAERPAKSIKRAEKTNNKGDSTNSRKPSKATKKPRSISNAEMSDDDDKPAQPVKRQVESSSLAISKTGGKKQRLLPRNRERTLFDDDDGFEDFKERKRVPGGFRTLGKREGQFGLGAPSRRLGGRGLEAYAEISPLRRDLRAAKD